MHIHVELRPPVRFRFGRAIQMAAATAMVLSVSASAAPAHGERLLMLSWDLTEQAPAGHRGKNKANDRATDSDPAAAQVESVLWTLMPSVGNWMPASFSPRRDVESAQAAQVRVRSTREFVLADADGRRNPESLELAAAAFFEVKRSLSESSPSVLGDAAFLLAVPTLRNGQDALAQDYVRLALHVGSELLQRAGDFGADVERLVAKTNAEDDLARPAVLRVSLLPADGTVLLDGKPISLGNGQVSAKPGMHLLQAVSGGHFPKGWIVEWGGQVDRQSFQLDEHPSRTRWDAAMRAARSTSWGDEGLHEPAGVADLAALSEADAVLAVGVKALGAKGTSAGWALRLGVWRSGSWSAYAADIAKDAGAPAAFTALLQKALPAPAPAPTP